MTNQEIRSFQKFYESFTVLHPFFPERSRKYEERYEELLGRNISLEDALTDFTVSVEDGHTNMEIPYQENSLCVNAICAWERQGLRIVDTTAAHVEPGDIVVGVGKESIASYFRFLESRIPHENSWLVKSRSSRFPYENYHALSCKNYSIFCDSPTSCMDLTVLRKGKLIKLQEIFVKYDKTLRFIDETEKNRFSFTEDGTGVLTLVTCSYDDETKKLLYDFFDEVKRRQGKKIIVDLSENMGGNSNIIKEFLKYLAVDKYKPYQIYERDGRGLKCIQSRLDYQYNSRCEWSNYNGEIICNIGNDTFSSARMFAAVLRDNNFALLSGEPSGGKPSSCGQPARFQIMTEAGEKLRYRISTRLFLRPNGRLDNQETLMPDLH